MSFFNHDEAYDAHRQLYDDAGRGHHGHHHQAHLSHELIAGAAGFEAMKAYENHVKKQGKPVGHEKMKEFLAAFVAAEIDRLIETKGMRPMINTWIMRH
jgi:hypothetical protein